MSEDKMTQTIVLAESDYGSVNVWLDEDYIRNDPDYFIISEPMTVTFTAREDDVILQGRISAIDNKIEAARAEMTRRIAGLTDQKQRLLAITHEEPK